MISVDEPEMPAPAGASRIGGQVDAGVRARRISPGRRAAAACIASRDRSASRSGKISSPPRSRERRTICESGRVSSVQLAIAIHGEIHRDRVRVVEIQRPDVERAAGQIHAARRLGEYLHRISSLCLRDEFCNWAIRYCAPFRPRRAILPQPTRSFGICATPCMISAARTGSEEESAQSRSASRHD